MKTIKGVSKSLKIKWIILFSNYFFITENRVREQLFPENRVREQLFLI